MVLRCRVSETEHQQIVLRAESMGLSVSSLLRDAALDVPIRASSKSIPGPTLQVLSQLIGQLGRVGNNLNQLTHRAHLAGQLSEMRRLHDALIDLQQLYLFVVEAM